MVNFLWAPPLAEVRDVYRRREKTDICMCYVMSCIAIVLDLPSFVRVLMCHDWGRFVLCFVTHNVSKETTESIKPSSQISVTFIAPQCGAEVESKSVWSTLIGRGSTRLVSHCSECCRHQHSYALKNQIVASKAPCSLLVLYGIRVPCNRTFPCQLSSITVNQ